MNAAQPRMTWLKYEPRPAPTMTPAEMAAEERARFRGVAPKRGPKGDARGEVLRQLVEKGELTTDDIIQRLRTYRDVDLPLGSARTLLCRMQREGLIVKAHCHECITVWALAPEWYTRPGA